MNAGKKSKLVPVGMTLIMLGLFFSHQLVYLAQPMNAGAIKTILLMSSDILKLCFLIGLICTVIGALKNRKMKRQTASDENKDRDI